MNERELSDEEIFKIFYGSHDSEIYWKDRMRAVIAAAFAKQEAIPTVAAVGEREYHHGERLGNELQVVKVRSIEWMDTVKAEMYDVAVPFWQKYAIGSKLHPSCFGCGHPKTMSTRHADLPDIFLCVDCVAAICTLPAAPVAQSPGARDAERLDYLEGELQNECSSTYALSLFRKNIPITRAAIDAAIAAQKESTK